MTGIAIFFLVAVGFVLYIMIRPARSDYTFNNASSRNSRERGFGDW